jgi:hypothetical protein
MQPRKISMAEIQQLQRVLESAPEYQVEEFTKMDAIRMLAPHIRAMQSKGYSLSAIAGMFSDNGVAVTSVALKSYLGQVKGSRRKKAPRKSKPASPVERGVAVEGASEVGRSDGPTVRSKPPETADGGAGREKSGSKAAPAPALPSGATQGPKATPPRIEEGASRRSAFVPRRDTEDI